MARYIINFENNLQKESLSYKIVDTPVSRIWLDITKKHIEYSSPIPKKSQWFNIFPSEEKIVSLINELMNLIDQINNKKIFKEKLYFKFNNETLQENLNYLHLQFHRLEETQESNDFILGEFNVKIHEIETALYVRRKPDTKNVSAGFYLFNPAILKSYVEISDPSLYTFWSNPGTSGSLVLGYHTVGKNIFHCCLNNDIELVKSKMVRPQKNISTEIMLYFSSITEDSESKLKSYKELTYNWIKENQLEEFIDMSLPENNLFGWPTLGEIEHNYSIEDINKIISIGNVSSVKIE